MAVRWHVGNPLSTGFRSAVLLALPTDSPELLHGILIFAGAALLGSLIFVILYPSKGQAPDDSTNDSTNDSPDE